MIICRVAPLGGQSIGHHRQRTPAELRRFLQPFVLRDSSSARTADHSVGSDVWSRVAVQHGHQEGVVAAPLPQQGLSQPPLDGEPALLVHVPRPRVVLVHLEGAPVQRGPPSDRLCPAATPPSGGGGRTHGQVSCCGTAPVSTADQQGQIVCGGDLYDPEAAKGAPDAAVAASLGCGVPTAVADLHPGEVVLDLGSGAGADVLICARRVGPAGWRSAST